MTTTTKVKCLRCGKCCVVLNDKGVWEYCKYLRWLSSGISYCIIYNNRIGANLGHGFICGYRDDLHYNIPDCPYNKKGLNTHPAYK